MAYVFEWVKLFKCQLKEMTCRKLANGQDIDYYEKNGPRTSSAPLLGLFSIIFKHVYWYILYNRSQVSIYRTIGPLVCVVAHLFLLPNKVNSIMTLKGVK